MAGGYKDYYAVLGVKKESSLEELKQAYRRLAKQHHPDLQPEKDKAAASERFKELNEAYEVLSNPEKRAKYDRLGADWDREPPPERETPRPNRGRSAGAEQAGGFEGFSDFFENLYGGAGGPGRGARSERGGRGQDVEAEMPLSLEEAVRGGEKKISLDVPTLCPACGGTGRKGRGFCPECGGVGELSRPKSITARLPQGAGDEIARGSRGRA